MSLVLTHRLGESIALGEDGAAPLWCYDYGTRPKPFCHPIHTPAGRLLTNYEPHDHVWHRGLWWTIKFVAGHNFWEENEPYGLQQTHEGPFIFHGDDGSVQIQTGLAWTIDGTPLIAEDRVVGYLPLDDESYLIEWSCGLSALADLRLDRTPYTTWGGYGGLCLRGNRNWYETEIELSDGTKTARPTGLPAEWASLQGKIDGGRASFAGAALFDHPENPRYPTPWYGATGIGHYLNAAFLFHEPMELSGGESLEFRQAMLVHDNLWPAERIEATWREWVQRVDDMAADDQDGCCCHDCHHEDEP